MEEPSQTRPKQQVRVLWNTEPRLASQWGKGGRSWCRCATTDYRHGPYRYLRWREYYRTESGALACRHMKTYVRKADVEQAQARLRQRRHRARLRKQAEFAEEQACLESGLVRQSPVRAYRPRRRPLAPPAPLLTAQELAAASGLTVSDLVALNRIRLLCPQGPWSSGGRRWRRWRYRPNLTRWAGRLRERRAAGEKWRRSKPRSGAGDNRTPPSEHWR